jgi:type 1 glutamine amidotransferase
MKAGYFFKFPFIFRHERASPDFFLGPPEGEQHAPLKLTKYSKCRIFTNSAVTCKDFAVKGPVPPRIHWFKNRNAWWHRKKMKTMIKVMSVFSLLAGLYVCNAQSTLKNVLVLDKTGLPYSEPIVPADSMMAQLGRLNNFSITITLDTSLFNDDSLQRYQIIVFNNVGRNVLANYQQDAFIRYIENGGGYVGWHASATAQGQWPWYTDSFVGGDDAPGTAKAASLVFTDTVARAGHGLGANHPIMKGVPKSLPQYGEWYDWNPNPANNAAITVLQWYATAGIFSNVPSAFPETWCREYGAAPKKGRMFYTELSHQDSVYKAAWFRTMVLNALKWAAHDGETPVTEPGKPPDKHFSVNESFFLTSDRKNRQGYYSLNGRAVPFQPVNQLLVQKRRSGSASSGVVVR